jgi:predicted nucleic acid-binding protein
MFLLDTNILLEIILSQSKNVACKKFIRSNIGRVYVSDFSLYSVGIYLLRRNKEKQFPKVLRIISNISNRTNLKNSELTGLSSVKTNFNLDFDDAYLYQVAKERNLTLVNLDNDFRKVKDIKVIFL